MMKIKTPKFLKSELIKGFTLVELMVSVSIFSMVMLVIMGSILTVIDANKKSQTLRSVMDNLNFSLESMTRDIRFGENYHCGSAGTLTDPADCPAGDTVFHFKMNATTQASYRRSGSQIEKSVDGGATYLPITSPDIVIEDLKFWVLGSQPFFSASHNASQPRVIIVVRGYVGVKQTTRSSFVLETTVSQKKLDL